MASGPHKLFEVGQKAFIEKSGEVLVVYFPNGWLDLPGGRIDEGETDIIAALKREVREETSLEIEVGAPIATWLGRAQTVFIVGYRCRYVSGEVQLSDEHASYSWVSAKTTGNSLIETASRFVRWSGTSTGRISNSRASLPAEHALDTCEN